MTQFLTRETIYGLVVQAQFLTSKTMCSWPYFPPGRQYVFKCSEAKLLTSKPNCVCVVPGQITLQYNKICSYCLLTAQLLTSETICGPVVNGQITLHVVHGQMSNTHH